MRCYICPRCLALHGERSTEQQGEEQEVLVVTEYGRSKERAQNQLGSGNPNVLKLWPK
jgi:hypothetical protein